MKEALGYMIGISAVLTIIASLTLLEDIHTQQMELKASNELIKEDGGKYSGCNEEGESYYYYDCIYNK